MPEHFGLQHFRTRIFDYRPGHHAAFFGPTQIAGKSTLALALLEVVSHQLGIPATALVMKHSDRTVAGWTERLQFRETPSWPPARRWRDVFHRPPGYTLWPPQTLFDEHADNARLRREFRAAITHNRTHTPSITFADELYGLVAELNLRELLTAVVTRDSGAGHGLWYATQKPSGTQGNSIPGFFFNSAEHMFLSKDGEARNRRRYAEIACGIPAEAIERETLALGKYSWLYIRRSGPEWAVVDAYDPSLAF
jgi:hypothetical protein